MATQLKQPVDEKDHYQGVAEATIELVQYGDYQCPHCGAAHAVIKQVQETCGSRIRFIFRHFPLTQIHPIALSAALAAEAAGMQQQFWEMHDRMYQDQSALDSVGIRNIAAAIGLDMEIFEADLQLDVLQAKIEADYESGARSGVHGTPSFFINGDKFDGTAQDLFDMLQQVKGLD